MDAPLQALLIRLIRTMGHQVDPDWLSDEDAWAFLPKLAAPLRAGRGLPAGVMHIIMEVGLTLAIRPGAPPGAYQQALENQLGPSPLSAGDFAEFVTLMRGQVNGFFEAAVSPRSGPSLSGEGQKPTPNKNYDYS